MATIGLIGATGMIGSAVKAELEQSCHVVTMGRGKSNARQLDLLDPDSFSQESFGGIDTLVHCGGVIDEDFRDNPAAAFSKGTYTSAKLAEAACEAGVHTLVYVSSAHVYGPLTGTINENSPPNPVSDYAICHYATEQIFRRVAARDKSLRLLILRPCATYGMPANMERFQRWSLVPFLFPRKAVDRQSINLLSGSDHISRNFISAQGIGRHILHFIQNAADGSNNIINPVGPYDASIRDFAILVANAYQKITGRDCSVDMPSGAPDLPPPLCYRSVSKDQPEGQPIQEFVSTLISTLHMQKAHSI